MEDLSAVQRAKLERARHTASVKGMGMKRDLSIVTDEYQHDSATESVMGKASTAAKDASQDGGCAGQLFPDHAPVSTFPHHAPGPKTSTEIYYPHSGRYRRWTR